jgi:hypothetical protein
MPSLHKVSSRKVSSRKVSLRSKKSSNKKRSTTKRSTTKRSTNKRSTKKRSPKVRIAVEHKGSLTKFGWSSSKNKEERQKALKRASKEFDGGEIIKKLNLLAIYNKNRNPKLVNKVHTDMHFVQTQLM